ncbi:hypothetical protein AB990_12690 [Alkalihalobacillus pseudalcaliphilus]|nr:hypothetical protein AB990_12690 [Alkalihalobacillus pseudalcaliphilus]
METWLGASAICLNNRNEVLMVKNADVDGWSVPSGEIERGETAAQCCVREVKEETGYTVKTIKQLYVKETLLKSIRVTAYYFEVEAIGESQGFNDPEQTIVETAWIPISELEKIKHVYPEDLEIIRRFC